MAMTSMTSMTSKERFMRMYQHKEADRIPIIDSPWAGTIKRWQNEGMPVGADWREFFNVDKVQHIGADITPRYEEKIIEQNERYKIFTTSWGVTLKQFNELDSTPEFLDFTVTTQEAWQDAKKRMTIDEDRIDWKYLEKNYDSWVKNGDFITAGFWFGFDVTHSWMVGTETLLMAMLENPEWVKDMIDTYLNSCIKMFDMAWDRGYRFDEITWPDDMGYKGTAFFSNDIYRDIVQPFHKRACDWAHDKGIYARLHSCGDIRKLLPDIIDAGIDALNPIEIKAGMDPLIIKQTYGDKIVLHGGINAVLWDDKDAITSEIARLVPTLKQNGGYIFSSDHSIPNNVTLEDFRHIIEQAKKYGTY